MIPRTKVLQAVIVAWSFTWTLLVGHLGIFALDQSLVFDGGWRIFSGQVPFRDFIMPFPPLTFWLQAAFFKVFGVSWTSQVLSAACCGAIAALSAMRTIHLLFGKPRRWLILGAGFLVGTSFQSMFGTLYMEVGGLLCFFLGIQAVCESLACPPRWQPLCFAAAGMFSVLSFLAKQNMGTLAFAALATVTLAAAPPSIARKAAALCAFAAGAAVTGGAFLGWLQAYANPHLFFRYAIQAASEVGRGRIHLSNLVFLPHLLGYVRDSTQWCYAIALGVVFRAVMLSITDRDFRRELLGSPSLRVALAVTAVCPFVQSIFQMTTMNQSLDVLSLSGLILVLGVGLSRTLPQSEAAKRQVHWISILGCITAAFLTVEVMYFGWHRQMHDVFPMDAGISRPLRVPRLSHVRWLQPTWASAGIELRETDVEGVAAYLASRRQDFLVIGDATYFYGVMGVVPPSPLLYYQKHHYYLEQDYASLDDWILADLKKRDIRIIVREKKNAMPEGGFFPFPKSVGWIEREFHPGPVFGNFEILVR